MLTLSEKSKILILNNNFEFYFQNNFLKNDIECVKEKFPTKIDPNMELIFRLFMPLTIQSVFPWNLVRFFFEYVLNYQ